MATGFKPVTAAEIYSQYGIVTSDVQAIADALSVKLPCSTQAAERIATFAANAKKQGVTIKQSIASLNSSPTQQPQPQAQQATQTQFAGDVRFTGTSEGETMRASQAIEQHSQNRLSLEKFGGMAERLQELAARGQGRERLDSMLAGIVQPESPAEVQFLLMARQVLGHNEAVVPDFLQIDPQGNILVDCQKMLEPAGNINTALNLLPAAIGTRTVPMLPASNQ